MRGGNELQEWRRGEARETLLVYQSQRQKDIGVMQSEGHWGGFVVTAEERMG